MANETCGWLIKGDPSRPCAEKIGHNSTGHRDTDQLRQRAEARAAAHRRDNPSWINANKVRTPTENGTCGWLVKGDTSRPCFLKLGHVSTTHRDASIILKELKAGSIRTRARRQGPQRDKILAMQRIKYRNRVGSLSAEGFAYVLVSKFRPGIVKLGSARNLKQNLASARRYLPDAEHVRAYPGGEWLERRYLHCLFKDYLEPTDKMHHEWFAVPPEAVDAAVLILQILLQYPAFLMSKELL